MRANPLLLIDFDSTFVTVESLELLADLVLQDQPDGAERRAEIISLTEQAMNGEIGFAEALKRRLSLLAITRGDLETLSELLRAKVSPSFARNRSFFEEHGDSVYVISGGFFDYVAPVVAAFGIGPDRILANSFVFEGDKVVGLDESNPLSRDGGKIEAARRLASTSEVIMIGDGWTDLEVAQAGAADRFYAFTESAARPRVVAASDLVAATLDEVLHREGLTRRWSYPRSRIKVLLLENVHPDAVARFQDEGYDVTTETRALSEAELRRRIAEVSILGIRSKTQLTESVLADANRLLAVGAFCIGVNQIDLSACSQRGVAVFNAPYSNTRSVVELAIGEIILLVRRVFDKSVAAHKGRWDKSASGAHEIRGLTLGIVGYGAIGSQLSVMAESLGMSVIYFDLSEKLALGNAKRCRTLGELLANADVVSLHVDGRATNRNLIGAAELAGCKAGAILLNLSRGHVIDVDALASAIASGHIAGAGIDVFPDEPESNSDGFSSPLQGLGNTLITPHIGGSTEEAQSAIAEFAADRLLGFLHRGDTNFSVNLPNVQLSEVGGAHRLLHIHRNRPGVLAALNQVIAEGGLNILAQHLKTNEDIGYVIADVDRNYGDQALTSLKSLPDTLRFRTIY